jgi:hypothetical protein
LPATKPAAGLMESVKDPDSGKMKNQPKGLGKWRCTGCKKITAVTPRKPQASTIGGSVPDVVYPSTLHTPILAEVPIAQTTSN